MTDGAAASRVVETGTDLVRLEVVGRVGVMTLDRPARRNALHDDMYAPMIGGVDALAADPGVGALVLTGAGTAFCAGGDVRDGSGRGAHGHRPTPAERAANLAANSRITVVLHEAPIITIAAVNGPAVGAGLALALACDLRIAASSASFVTGWGRLGFSGDMGGPWLLAHHLGHAMALELLATGGSIDAEQALTLGLVQQVIDDEAFAATWHGYAATIAAGPQPALGHMKQNVLNAQRLPLADAVGEEARRQVECSASPDHREGVRAWLEKRPPVFGNPES